MFNMPARPLWCADLSHLHKYTRIWDTQRYGSRAWKSEGGGQGLGARVVSFFTTQRYTLECSQDDVHYSDPQGEGWGGIMVVDEKKETTQTPFIFNLGIK